MDRRVAIANSGGSWSPQNFGGMSAWFYAAAEYITESVGGEVETWADRSGNANDINNSTLSTCPFWTPNAWNGRHGVLCPLGTNEFLGNTGALGSTLFSGSDVRFSLLVTCQPQGIGSQLRTIWSWDDNVVQARSACYITTGSQTGYRRRGDDGIEVVSTAAGNVTADAHVRLVWSFSGTTISSWVDGSPGMVSAAANTNPCTFQRARLAEGPEAAADAFQGTFMEVIILPRAVLPAEVTLYQAYSLREWGL